MNRLWLPRGFYGLALTIGPASVLRLVGIDDASPKATAIVRILGLRDVTQALICAPTPTRPVALLGAGVDGLHAASMVALAVASPRWRRAGLFSGSLSLGFALLGVRQASRPRPHKPTAANRPPTLTHHLYRLVDARDRVAAALGDVLLPATAADKQERAA